MGFVVQKELEREWSRSSLDVLLWIEGCLGVISWVKQILCKVNEANVDTSSSRDSSNQ